MIRREADTFHSMLRPAPESVRGVAIGWCSCRVRAQKALCYNSQTDSQMPLARSLRMIVGSALFAGHGARAQRQLTEAADRGGCGCANSYRRGAELGSALATRCAAPTSSSWLRRRRKMIRTNSCQDLVVLLLRISLKQGKG